MHNAEQTSYSGLGIFTRRSCTNYKPVSDVLARHTSCLKYTLFVNGIFV